MDRIFCEKGIINKQQKLRNTKIHISISTLSSCFLEKSVQYVNRVNKVYLHPSLCQYFSKFLHSSPFVIFIKHGNFICSMSSIQNGVVTTL